jgi:predicted TIM-barrel fold metal-dependent hydrolase
MSKLDFAAFDADNHYYEAEDAFTRHIDPKMAKRAMQWANIDGKQRLLVGGRVNRFIPNPTFDPVAQPGCLDDYFRGRKSAVDIREAFGELEPIHASYRNRDARLEVMDGQGLESTFMFPTLGVGMESALQSDTDALLAAFSAFNRWLDDDWGFAHEERIFTAAYITLADVDWALDELKWALEHDLRVINMRPAPVRTRDGIQRSLGHPDHDRFWQAANEAGITIAFHAGDAGYGFLLDYWGQDSEFEAFRYSPLRSLLTSSPIADAMASMVAEGVFSRYPKLRACTIENGSEWVGPLFKKFKKAYGQHTHEFAEDPRDTFRKHVWVAPYYEDDLLELADTIGVDRMIFGSDYPHAEGLADPVSFADDLTGFDDAAIRKIMRDSGIGLTVRA